MSNSIKIWEHGPAELLMKSKSGVDERGTENYDDEQISFLWCRLIHRNDPRVHDDDHKTC